MHVAVNGDDDVVGFIVITAPPDPADADLPAIVRTMLDLAETLEMNGKPIARQRFALRGPVCIDKSARGHRVYSTFNAVTRRAYRDRFDIGILRRRRKPAFIAHHDDETRCHHWPNSRPTGGGFTFWPTNSVRTGWAGSQL